MLNDGELNVNERGHQCGSASARVSKTSQSETFVVGDRVHVRDSTEEKWRAGTVTKVSPVKVVVDGWEKSLSWNIVTKQADPRNDALDMRQLKMKFEDEEESADEEEPEDSKEIESHGLPQVALEILKTDDFLANRDNSIEAVGEEDRDGEVVQKDVAQDVMLEEVQRPLLTRDTNNVKSNTPVVLSGYVFGVVVSLGMVMILVNLKFGSVILPRRRLIAPLQWGWFSVPLAHSVTSTTSTATLEEETSTTKTAATTTMTTTAAATTTSRPDRDPTRQDRHSLVGVTSEATTTPTTTTTKKTFVWQPRKAAVQTGWGAFEGGADGSGKLAANPAGAKVVYQRLANGTNGCPPGLQISDQDECKLAVEALGMNITGVWMGSATDAPRFCSVTFKAPNTIVVNMNTEPYGQGRIDAVPVCLTVPKPRSCPACVSSTRIIPAVVIPFFERDLCKFRFTAKSIGVHDPHHLLGDVYFLWISLHSPAGYMDTIANTARELNKTHKVHFHDLSLVVKSSGVIGRVVQQVLMLKIASIITSDYYMVLDSKNTLIMDIEKDTLVTPCNQASTFAAYTAEHLPEPHRSWYQSTAAHLGVPWPQEGRWPDSISPMILRTQTVLDLIHSVGEKEMNSLEPELWVPCNGPLCGWFGSQGATAFILYQLYAVSKTNYDCFHGKGGPIVGSLWRGKTNKSRIEDESHTYFFGAQSGAFKDLRGEQRTQAGTKLREVFLDARLVNASDGGVTSDFMLSCLG
jgi:hypothetical protein